MKKRKKYFVIAFATILILFLAIYIYHRFQLDNEAELLTPLGEFVEIDGHNMSIYTEGTGDKTIVFMSGGGTCSPILDFKSLYSLLSDKYKIVVVEKFGYGFSDVIDKERTISSILEDTRTALKSAGIEAPYILCPHSMSGIEAIYWAQQYPDEISAIIGLDMAVPKAYEEYSINMPMLKLSQFAANIGITRILNVSESDAIKYGTLTENEKDIYRAVFFTRTATETMLNEVGCIKENAKIADEGIIPQVPTLLFVSNGLETGWDQETWRNYQNEYIEAVENGMIIEADCPHYIHNYEYEMISEKIVEFVSNNL